MCFFQDAWPHFYTEVLKKTYRIRLDKPLCKEHRLDTVVGTIKEELTVKLVLLTPMNQ